MIHIHVQIQIHIPVYISGMQFFHGKVKLISFQHRFRYTSENAGVVQTKEYLEMPWKTTKLLHPGVSVADVLSAGKVGQSVPCAQRVCFTAYSNHRQAFSGLPRGCGKIPWLSC